MTLSEFVQTYTGQAVDVDGVEANTGQCVQLVALYAQKVLGVTLPEVVGAKDLWDNPAVQEKFEQIPVGQQQPGDITVWGASNLINSPTYGHTDIYLNGTPTGPWTGFDSNWNSPLNAQGYPEAHEVTHNNTDVLGFLRLKEAEMSTIGDVEARILIKHIYGYTNEVDIESAIPGLLGMETNTCLRMMDASPTAAAYQQYIADLVKADNGATSSYVPYTGPGLYTKS